MLPILRENKGDSKALIRAIESAFFKNSQAPKKMARNTLISLRCHGIVDENHQTTAFGDELLRAKSEAEATEMLARNILTSLDGVGLVETLREMRDAGESFKLGSITDELRSRGFQVSDNSSDLSGVLNWLREAGVLNDYAVNEERYGEIVGTSPRWIKALKDLDEAQIAFLRALVSLGASDWTPHNSVAQHAEALYTGEVRYNWKDLDRSIIQPLVKHGFIEHQKAPKSGERARGGKAALVRPTAKFQKEVAMPILEPLYKSAGFRDVRKIRSIPLSKLVADIKQRKDEQLRGRSLEFLAIRICQLLDLDFMGWRETDEDLVAGGEVDGFMHSARLVYSRWQIQCKASDKITYEALAKEVGVAEVTLANVIMVVSTGACTSGADSFRNRIVSKTPLNIVIIDGSALEQIVRDPAIITSILKAQAREAMSLKRAPSSLVRTDKNGGDDGGGAPSQIRPRKSDATATSDDPGTSEPTLFSPYYFTRHGVMYHGDSYEVLRSLIRRGVRTKLLITSPPFALIRKKAYGNEDADRYVDWFMRFAPLFSQILEPAGSFVIDIGGTWIPGIPARSTYHYQLLLRLCQSGFYLAQEFYHYNPARLPTPAEWVTVRRMRVKDAINNVWWFVKDPFVDADNRRVLREYSSAMKGLLRNGYTPKLRPSGHDISAKFGVDHGGAIPPNLLEFANTESNSHYLKSCRASGIKPHPARFPAALPDFFIRFLTQTGDLVLDPFAGSNVTGETAEALARKWIAIELNEDYIKGSRFRFDKPIEARGARATGTERRSQAEQNLFKLRRAAQ